MANDSTIPSYQDTSSISSPFQLLNISLSRFIPFTLVKFKSLESSGRKKPTTIKVFFFYAERRIQSAYRTIQFAGKKPRSMKLTEISILQTLLVCLYYEQTLLILLVHFWHFTAHVYFFAIRLHLGSCLIFHLHVSQKIAIDPLFILRSCYQLALLYFSLFHFSLYLTHSLYSTSSPSFLSRNCPLSLILLEVDPSITSFSVSHFQFQFSPYKLSRNYCIRTENEPHFYDSFGRICRPCQRTIQYLIRLAKLSNCYRCRYVFFCLISDEFMFHWNQTRLNKTDYIRVMAFETAYFIFGAVAVFVHFSRIL